MQATPVCDPYSRLFVTFDHQLNPSELQIPKGGAFPRRPSITRDGDVMILCTSIVLESYSPGKFSESDVKMLGNMLDYVALELDLKSVRLQQYKKIFIPSVIMPSRVGITLISGWCLMCDATGPIRNTVSTVDYVRRGQLDSRVEGFMLGELDTLKNGVNPMAMLPAVYHEGMWHNVDQATSDLRETLERTEIQNVGPDLAEKHAQGAARTKFESLADMSHELRTPLNGVIGSTHLALETDLNATQRDHLATIERSVNNLPVIISDVLDFSKLEAGKLILESIPFLLRISLDEVVTLLAYSAHDKGPELTLNVKNNVLDNIIGDPLRLQQIVTNLMGSTIKFTEYGNTDALVEQRAVSNSRVQIEIQIHDTGTSTFERNQSRLFRVFRQANASISHWHGGTGFGLVTVRRLVKEMGGDTSFHSQPNRSFTFWLHISLGLNPSAVSDMLNTDGLTGRCLACVEANATAMQCTLEIPAVTPLETIHNPAFPLLARTQYDILLVSIPALMRDLSPYRGKLVKTCATSDNVLFTLLHHAQVSVEALECDDVTACLLKPLAIARLLSALVAINHVLVPASLTQTNSHRLPMTVMAADGNPANPEPIDALLDDLMQQAILYNSGQQAVDQAKRLQMDLTLMDIQMPDMDGIRACKLICYLSCHQQVSVTTVTACAPGSQREKLLSVGMNDYLARPIEEEKLHALSLHYQPGLPSVVPAALSPMEPAIDHNLTLDWQLALCRAAVKPGLVREMLQVLVAFTSEVHNKVEEQLVGEQPEGLVDLIHKLYGSYNHGDMPRLKEPCHTLESQLRSDTAVGGLEPESLEPLDELDNVVREACQMGV